MSETPRGPRNPYDDDRTEEQPNVPATGDARSDQDAFAGAVRRARALVALVVVLASEDVHVNLRWVPVDSRPRTAAFRACR